MEITCGSHETFAEEEPGRELEVVARGAHGDRETLGPPPWPRETDLQRLLGGEAVLAVM